MAQQDSFDVRDRVEYLRTEAEHYYASELQSEQRASWLLTIAFGIEAIVLNAFVQIFEKKVNARAAPALVVCGTLLFIAVVLALGAIWPLDGGRAVLSLPWRRFPRSSRRALSMLDVWEHHYEAHRRRAEVKTARVVWTLMAILAGSAAGIAAVIINSGLL